MRKSLKLIASLVGLTAVGSIAPIIASCSNSSSQSGLSSIDNVNQLNDFIANIKKQDPNTLNELKDLLYQKNYISDLNSSIQYANVQTSLDSKTNCVQLNLSVNVNVNDILITIDNVQLPTQINVVNLDVNLLSSYLKNINYQLLLDLYQSKSEESFNRIKERIISWNVGFNEQNIQLVSDYSFAINANGDLEVSIKLVPNAMFNKDGTFENEINFSVDKLNYDLNDDSLNQASFEFKDPNKTIITGLSPLGKTRDTLVIPSNVLGIEKLLDANEINNKILEIKTSNNSKLRNIRDGAFENFQKVKSISLPNTIVEIGTAAFRNCSSLESIKVANGNANDLSKLKIASNSLQGSTFEGCAKINNIRVWDNINEFGESCFKDCSSLSNISVGQNPVNDLSSLDSWKSINRSVFENTGAFESLILPKNLVMIGKSAFKNSKIRHFYLDQIGNSDNNRLQVIDDYAFYNCNNFIEKSLLFSASLDGNPAKMFVYPKIRRFGKYSFANTNIKLYIAGNGFNTYNNIPDSDSLDVLCCLTKEMAKNVYDIDNYVLFDEACFENSFNDLSLPQEWINGRVICNNYITLLENFKFVGPNCFNNSSLFINLNVDETVLNNSSFKWSESNFVENCFGQLIYMSQKQTNEKYGFDRSRGDNGLVNIFSKDINTNKNSNNIVTKLYKKIYPTNLNKNKKVIFKNNSVYKVNNGKTYPKYSNKNVLNNQFNNFGGTEYINFRSYIL
ncbi:MAG: leucine-rich repeat domain-containing protein [Ureaplasma sp.]|nr:leucine-rich repeat domain-containing protein [Ureaplasma sp.]